MNNDEHKRMELCDLGYGYIADNCSQAVFDRITRTMPLDFYALAKLLRVERIKIQVDYRAFRVGRVIAIACRDDVWPQRVYRVVAKCRLLGLLREHVVYVRDLEHWVREA